MSCELFAWKLGVIFRKLDPRRAFLVVECESEKQARELVENTLRWCEQRR